MRMECAGNIIQCDESVRLANISPSIRTQSMVSCMKNDSDLYEMSFSLIGLGMRCYKKNVKFHGRFIHVVNKFAAGDAWCLAVCWVCCVAPNVSEREGIHIHNRIEQHK